MFVDKKKMSDLANTLRKHGLAASTDDAVNLAKSVETKQGEVDQIHKEKFSDSDDLSIKTSQTQNLSQNPNQGETNMKNDQTLSKQQIIDVLQQFSDKFCAEVNKINNRISEIESQIKGLKDIKGSVQEQDTPSMQPEIPPETSQPPIAQEKEKTLDELYQTQESEEKAEEMNEEPDTGVDDTSTQTDRESEPMPESTEPEKEIDDDTESAQVSEDDSENTQNTDQPIDQEQESQEKEQKTDETEKKSQNPQDKMIDNVNLQDHFNFSKR